MFTCEFLSIQIYIVLIKIMGLFMHGLADLYRISAVSVQSAWNQIIIFIPYT